MNKLAALKLVKRNEFQFENGKGSLQDAADLLYRGGFVKASEYYEATKGSLIKSAMNGDEVISKKTHFLIDGKILADSQNQQFFFEGSSFMEVADAIQYSYGPQDVAHFNPVIKLLRSAIGEKAFGDFFASNAEFVTALENYFVTCGYDEKSNPIKQHWFFFNGKIAVFNTVFESDQQSFVIKDVEVFKKQEFVLNAPAEFVFDTLVYSSKLTPKGTYEVYARSQTGEYHLVSGYKQKKEDLFIQRVKIDQAPTTTVEFFGKSDPIRTSLLPVMIVVPHKLFKSFEWTVFALFAVGSVQIWSRKPLDSSAPETLLWLSNTRIRLALPLNVRAAKVRVRQLLSDAMGAISSRPSMTVDAKRKQGESQFLFSARRFLFNKQGFLNETQTSESGIRLVGKEITVDNNPLIKKRIYSYGYESDQRFAIQNNFSAVTAANTAYEKNGEGWIDWSEQYQYFSVLEKQLLISATVIPLNERTNSRHALVLKYGKSGEPLLTKRSDSELDDLHRVFFYANLNGAYAGIINFTGVMAEQSEANWKSSTAFFIACEYVDLKKSYLPESFEFSTETISIKAKSIATKGLVHESSILVGPTAFFMLLDGVFIAKESDYVIKVVFSPVGSGQVKIADFTISGSQLLADKRKVSLQNNADWLIDAIYFYDEGATFEENIIIQGRPKFTFTSRNDLFCIAAADSKDNNFFYRHETELLQTAPYHVWAFTRSIVPDAISFHNQIEENELLHTNGIKDTSLFSRFTIRYIKNAHVPSPDQFDLKISSTEGFAVVFDTRSQFSLSFKDIANETSVSFNSTGEGIVMDIGVENILRGVKTRFPRLATLAVMGNQVLFFIDGILVKLHNFEKPLDVTGCEFSSAESGSTTFGDGIFIIEGYTLTRAFSDYRYRALQNQTVFCEPASGANCLTLTDATYIKESKNEASVFSEPAFFTAEKNSPFTNFLSFADRALDLNAKGEANGLIADFYEKHATDWFKLFSTPDVQYPYSRLSEGYSSDERRTLQVPGYVGHSFPKQSFLAQEGELIGDSVLYKANSSFVLKAQTALLSVKNDSAVARYVTWASWRSIYSADSLTLTKTDSMTTINLSKLERSHDVDLSVSRDFVAFATSQVPLRAGAVSDNLFKNIRFRKLPNGKYTLSFLDQLGRIALSTNQVCDPKTLDKNSTFAYYKRNKHGRVIETGTVSAKAKLSLYELNEQINRKDFPSASYFCNRIVSTIATYRGDLPPQFANELASATFNGTKHKYARVLDYQWNKESKEYDFVQKWHVNQQERMSLRTVFKNGLPEGEQVICDGIRFDVCYEYDQVQRVRSISLSVNGQKPMGLIKEVAYNFEGAVQKVVHETGIGDLVLTHVFNIDRSLQSRSFTLGEKNLMSEKRLYGLEKGLQGYFADFPISMSIEVAGQRTEMKYEYDFYGRLMVSSRNGMESIYYSYTDRSELQKVVEGKNETVYQYENSIPVNIDKTVLSNDGMDVTSLTDIKGEGIKFDYDVFNQIVSVEKTNGDYLKIERDSEGRIVSASSSTASKKTEYLFYYDLRGAIRTYWIDSDFYYNFYHEGLLVAQYRSATKSIAYVINLKDGSKITEVSYLGIVQENYSYTDFGKPERLPKDSFEILYSGYGYFRDFGFYVTGPRVYFPELRLYLQHDPSFADPAHSPYCYATNNPIAFFDKSGLAPEMKIKYMGKGFRAYEKEDFIKQFSKDGAHLVSDSFVYGVPPRRQEIVVDVSRAEANFVLDPASKTFLQNAMHTNSFTGLGDISTKILYIHPLYPPQNLSGGGNDFSIYKPYSGPYDERSAIGNLPILHAGPGRRSGGLAPHMKDLLGIEILATDDGGPAHAQMFSVLHAKHLVSDAFGFALLVNAPEKSYGRNPGNLPPIMNSLGQRASSLRTTSRSTNSSIVAQETFNSDGYNSRYLEVVDHEGKKVVLYMHEGGAQSEFADELRKLRPGLDVADGFSDDDYYWPRTNASLPDANLSDRLARSISRSIASEMNYAPEKDPFGFLRFDDQDVFAGQ